MKIQSLFKGIFLFVVIAVLFLVYSLLLQTYFPSKNEVILIDTSLSMSIQDEDGSSRLEKSKELVGELLHNYSHAYALVECNSQGILRVPYTNDRKVLQSAIQTLSFEHEKPVSTNILSCINFILAFENAPSRVYVFSDGENHGGADITDISQFPSLYIFPLGKEVPTQIPNTEYISEANHLFLQMIAVKSGGKIIKDLPKTQIQNVSNLFLLALFLLLLLLYNTSKRFMGLFLLGFISIAFSSCSIISSVNDELYEQMVQLYQNESFNESLEAYKQVDHKSPVHALFYYNAGNVLYKNNEFEDAVLSYRKHLEDNADDIDTLYNIGNGYVKLFQEKNKNEDYLLAKIHYEKVLELDKDHKESLHNLSELERFKKKKKEESQPSKQDRIKLQKQFNEKQRIDNYIQQIIEEDSKYREKFQKILFVPEEKPVYQDAVTKPW